MLTILALMTKCSDGIAVWNQDVTQAPNRKLDVLAFQFLERCYDIS